VSRHTTDDELPYHVHMDRRALEGSSPVLV